MKMCEYKEKDKTNLILFEAIFSPFLVGQSLAESRASGVKAPVRLGQRWRGFAKMEDVLIAGKSRSGKWLTKSQFCCLCCASGKTNEGREGGDGLATGRTQEEGR